MGTVGKHLARYQGSILAVGHFPGSQAESLQAPQVSEPQAVELTFLISIVNCKLWAVSSPGGRQLTARAF